MYLPVGSRPKSVYKRAYHPVCVWGGAFIYGTSAVPSSTGNKNLSSLARSKFLKEAARATRTSTP